MVYWIFDMMVIYIHFFGVITLIHALNFVIVLYVKLLAGSKLQELSLMLSLSCLSFDFMGTSYDESSDEIGTNQVYIFPLLIDVCLFCFPIVCSSWFGIHVVCTGSINLETCPWGFLNIADIFWLLYNESTIFKRGLFLLVYYHTRVNVF